MLYFPSHIDDIQTTCALRFDGWAYIGQFREQDIPEIVDRFERTLETLPDELDNFAIYFALQRHISKWGGEYSTKYSESHYAFDFLFLHLYRLPTPSGFIKQEYEIEWTQRTTEEIEAAAGFVRKSFVRRGRGPKIKT